MNRVIITGVSDGLGLELAKTFINNDFDVVGISRQKPNLKITHLKTDLNDNIQISKTIKTIKKEFSHFDALINNAGIFYESQLQEVNPDKVLETYRINTIAPIQIIAGLLDEIKKNEADIINIGSTAGYKSIENQLVYSSTKWALRGIDEGLRSELKQTKCRVISFNPGGFKSNMYKKATGRELTADNSWMEPHELSKLIFSLISLPKNMEVSQIIINRN